MGRLEKIVVLTVLFLVAVILAISLKGEKKPAPKSLAALDKTDSPVAPPDAAGADSKLAGAANSPQVGDPKAPVTPATSANGLISTVVKPDAQATPPVNKPAEAPFGNAGKENPVVTPTKDLSAPISTPPAGSMLKTREGLRDSFDPQSMIYEWKAGDSFKTLAVKYYGSEKFVGRLHMANEGRNEANLKVGDAITVPTLDAATVSTKSAGDDKGTASKTAVGDDGFYVVKKGDLLSSISQKVYGSSKKWQKIYDANRDLLKDPNALKVGMKLRIPN